MSTDGNQPAVTIEEVREALLKLEGAKAEVRPDEETKKLDAPAKPKKEEPLPPDLPEQVKRTQKIIEAIHAGRELRATLVAAKLRRGVEVENELRQADKDRAERVFGARRIHEEEVIQADKLRDFRVNVIESAFDVLTEQRQTELAGRGEEISKLDKRLEQLRKQLDAELVKLDPDRKAVPA